MALCVYTCLLQDKEWCNKIPVLHLAVLKFDNYEIHVDLHQSQHIAFVRHTPLLPL